MYYEFEDLDEVLEHAEGVMTAYKFDYDWELDEDAEHYESLLCGLDSLSLAD